MLNVDEQALKKATAALVKAAGGCEAAADYCRVSKSQLADYGSLNGVSYIPADVAADLEAVTHEYPGHPHVTQVLARRAGYALVPLPRPAPEDKSLPEHIACIVSETSDVTNKVLRNFANGAITPKAIRDSHVLTEVDEAIQALVDLRAALRSQLGN